MIQPQEPRYNCKFSSVYTFPKFHQQYRNVHFTMNVIRGDNKQHQVLSRATFTLIQFIIKQELGCILRQHGQKFYDCFQFKRLQHP